MEEKIDVLMTVGISEEQLTKLQLLSQRLNIHINKANHVEEISPEEWATAEVLYTGRVIPTPELAPNLRWVQFHFAGIDHAREAPILKREGLVATTMSGASATQVAEYILMMMLALGHRLPDMMEHQRKSIWPKDRWDRFQPMELRETIVGIVGYGSIGRQVARLLQPFGTIVFATKRDAKNPDDSGYIIDGFGDRHGDYVHRIYPGEALRSMAKIADFLVITVPLSDSTRDLVDQDIIQVMKETSFIIDTSRGGVINQNALINALREKRIAGAALDVFPDEPLSVDNPLWKFPNVIITPHISGNTQFYDERAMELFSQNLQRYIEDQPLLNEVQISLGY